MFTAEEILYLKELYANIFGENADNSEEFIIFANGIPNPLRIKVEDWIANINRKLAGDILTVIRIHDAIELDTFITNYIENTYE